MKTIEGRILALLAGCTLVLALALLGSGALRPAAGHAAQTQTMSSYREPSADQQTAGDLPAATGDDHKVAIQAWTIMAAGGAAAFGLLLFFLRIALGRVPPPPPQEEAHH
jgi:hypothetical protein